MLVRSIACNGSHRRYRTSAVRMTFVWGGISTENGIGGKKRREVTRRVSIKLANQCSDNPILILNGLRKVPSLISRAVHGDELNDRSCRTF